MNSSNWTGRTPRTVQQAFGTYTSREVAPQDEAPSKAERIANTMFAVALGLIGAVILYTLWVR